MSEYSAIFDARGEHYNLANQRFPLARREEAHALLDHLDLANGSEGTWLDLAAGGGYLAERARHEGVERHAVACDASLSFLLGPTAYRARSVSQYDLLPFADGTFAATGCLAAFHHLANPETVVAEMLRVTARCGRAAVGDVAPGSRTADFLNGFVNAHTDTGHHGRFNSADALLGAFASAGGNNRRAQELNLTWHFPSPSDAIDFSRELFGLRPQTPEKEIAAALRDLGLIQDRAETRISWSMVFASAAR